MNQNRIILFFKENKWNLGLQLLFWIGTYIVWLHFATLRFWTSLSVEHIVFWVLFLAVNIHNWALFPRLYQKQYIKAYFIATSLLFLGTVLIEYSLAARYILIRLSPEDRIPEYIISTKFEIFGAVFIRDFMFFLAFTIYYLYRDSIRYQRAQAKEIENIKEQERVRDEMLYRFCHEHFTGNALAILSARFPDNPEDGKKMLSQLFDIYKYSLSQNPSCFVPIKEEIKFAETLSKYYQNIYIGSNVEIEIKGDIPPYSIPPLITESIIGNAFKHGKTDESSKIEIIFDFSKIYEFSFICRNKHKEGASSPRRSANFHGLMLVEERIKSLYGEGALFKWGQEDEYFSTKILLPL